MPPPPLSQYRFTNVLPPPKKKKNLKVAPWSLGLNAEVQTKTQLHCQRSTVTNANRLFKHTKRTLGRLRGGCIIQRMLLKITTISPYSMLEYQSFYSLLDTLYICENTENYKRGFTYFNFKNSSDIAFVEAV